MTLGDVEFAHRPVQKLKERGFTGRLICEHRIHPARTSEPPSRPRRFERRNGSLTAILRVIGLIVAGPPTTSDRYCIIAILGWKGDPEASITMRSNMVRVRRHTRFGVSAQACPRPGVSNSSSRSTPPHGSEIPVGRMETTWPESRSRSPVTTPPSAAGGWRRQISSLWAACRGDGHQDRVVLPCSRFWMLRPSTVHANAARAPVGGREPGIHAARSPVQEGSAKESEGLSLVQEVEAAGSLWGSCA